MIKKYIASIVFLFSSLSIFLFFFIKKIPENFIFLAQLSVELSDATKMTIWTSDFIINNWTVVILFLIFSFIANVIIAIVFKNNNKTLDRFFILNIILSVLFLGVSIFTYLSTELYISKIVQEAITERNSRKDLNNGNIKKDEIKDWKIYSNEEFGFEVKYPSKWYIADRGSGLAGKALSIIYITDINLEPMINDPKFVALGIQMLDFSVAVFKNDGSYLTGPHYDEKKYPVEETMVDNFKAIKQTNYYEQEPKVITWVEVINGDYIYVFEGAGRTGDNIFDQILSTFKFIEKDGIQGVK